MAPIPAPLMFPPILPSALLTSMVQRERHPTTLIICSSRAEFLTSLINDVQNPPAHPEDAQGPAAAGTSATTTSSTNPLLTAPLYQVAVARHLRVVFVPTVSHLRAHLSVFSPAGSKVSPPPPPPDAGQKQHQHQYRHQHQRPPLLLVYGFLALHRDTSEWSAQGIGATAAALVDAGRRCGFRPVLVDAPRETAAETAVGRGRGAGDGNEGEDDEGDGSSEGEERAVADGSSAELILAEEVPVLGASVVRAGGDLDDATFTSRKVTLGRVLGRWFRYRERGWAREAKDEK